jgi:hypothetical protein
MTKRKKSQAGSLDPEDVIAGRMKTGPRELALLIRTVNPTGLDLSPNETARRYVQKSRLQSLLITRFRDDIEVRAEPAPRHPQGEPGVVSLRHRPSGLDACHAVIAELSEEARAWVQRLVDMESVTARTSPEHPPRSQARLADIGKSPGSSLKGGESGGTDGLPLPVSELLRAGHEAARDFDYDAARTHFAAGLARSRGGAESAEALLSLLVDDLGADGDALAVEEHLSAEAREEPSVRLLLAIASARSGERERALRYVREGGARDGSRQGASRRAELSLPRVAEVFLELARAALAAGQLDVATEDIARARERDPARPELLGLLDTLAKARASARAPAEEELSQIFARGDTDAAERRAREILAKWPDSEVGRRITRAIEELRRREQAKERLTAAREALSRGEATVGLLLLRQALAGGLQGDDAAWAEGRIAAIQGEMRAREELAHIEDVRRLIQSGDLSAALFAYATLDSAERQAVRKATGALPLAWLEELKEAGSGTKARVAVPAALALHRAAEIAATEPKTALELLSAHADVVSGFRPAEKIRREAQRALAENRKREDQQRVLAARAALLAGELDRADELLGHGPAEGCTDEEKAEASALRASIARGIEERELTAILEQHRKGGDGLRALAAVEERLARGEGGDDVPRLTRLRTEIRADVRQRFCVHVERLPTSSTKSHAGAVPGMFHEMGVTPEYQWNTLVPIALPGAQSGEAVVLGQTRCEWVFLRVIHVAAARETLRVTLRTPEPLTMITAKVAGRRLILVGRFGAVLELSLDDWSVLRWCANVLASDMLSRALFMAGPPVIAPKVLEDAAVSADGRFLWLNTIIEPKRGSQRHVVHVVDLEKMRVQRDIPVPPNENVSVREVRGLAAPRMAVLRRSGRGLTLYDVRGTPPGDTSPTPFLGPNTVTVSPSGERIFAVLLDPEHASDPYDAGWGWIEVAGQSASPFRFFDGVTAVNNASAVTSKEAGMTFVLFEMEHRDCELYGLREGRSGLEIAYHVLLPQRAVLVGSPDARRAAVIALYDDHVEIAILDATPPRISRDKTPPLITLPSLPVGPLNTMLDCDEPTGALREDAARVCNELLSEQRPAMLRLLAAARSRASADELLLMEAALLMGGEIELGAQMGVAARTRFPKNPRVGLSLAGLSGKLGKWSEVLDRLSTVDPAGLPYEGEVMHFYHLRGIAKMMLGKPDAAFADLKRAAEEDGACLIHPFLALCAPLSDNSRSWTPNEVSLRALMSIVARADAALERGDPALALRTLNSPRVWEAREAQSLARFAEAYLRTLEAGIPCDNFRMPLALLSFCELFEARNTPIYREMPLPRSAWSRKRLADVAEKARARADELLTQAAKLP